MKIHEAENMYESRFYHQNICHISNKIRENFNIILDLCTLVRSRDICEMWLLTGEKNF